MPLEIALEKMNNKILILIFGIWLFGLISAGCCFDSANGICAENSEREACESGGGIYDQTSCEHVDECMSGCCVLGTNSLYITSRECTLQSRVSGFAADFRLINEESCLLAGNSNSMGACIYETEYETECYYSSPQECVGGEFHNGALCSSSEFNGVCSRTEETICSVDDDVYYVDSCGNRDEVKESCDYDSGTICKQTDHTTAVCHDLNCGNRENGETWCASEELGPVGSQAFRQYCADGEIYTERCADYRAETCVSGSCTNNPAAQCLGVNVSNPTEECDSRYCDVFNNTVVTNSSMIAQPPLTRCVPKISQGFQFWPTNGVSSSTGVCSEGNYGTIVSFKRNQNHHHYNLLHAYINPINYKAIIDPIMRHWITIDGWKGGDGSHDIHTFHINSLSETCAFGNSLMIAPGYGRCGDKTRNGCLLAACVKDGYRTTMPIHPSFVESLINRCRALGDCGGKENYLPTGAEDPSFEEGNLNAWLQSDSAETGAFIGNIVIKNDLGNKTFEIPCVAYTSDSHRHTVTCTLNFTCSPYDAPTGDAYCDACNRGDLPCSEYRCKSLGDTCDYEEPLGIDNGYCISANDFSPPTISSEIRKEGAEDWASPSEGNNFEYGEKIEINISTNELSICKFNIGHSSAGNFENTSDYVDKEYSMAHAMRLAYDLQEPGLDNMQEHELLGESGNVRLYVYCNDPKSNFNIAPHIIDLQIGEPEDRLPPQIIESSINPKHGSYVLHNATEKLISFKLNEKVSGCKYDYDDKDYDFMNNSFQCSEDNCLGLIPISSNENKIFIRCNDLKGNKNSIAKEHVLYRPQEKLKIESLIPLKSYTRNTTYILDLNLRTSGGTGDEICSFKVANHNKEYLEFLIKEGNYHIQKLTLPLGTHNILVKCIDSSNEGVFFSERLSINQDINSPIISRVYALGNFLILRTTEEAECRFDKYDCNKEFDSMKLFTGDGLKHKVTGRKGDSYYIKCKDELGNIPQKATCSRIVKLLT